MAQSTLKSDYLSIIPDRLSSKVLLLFKGSVSKNISIRINDTLGNLISNDDKEVREGENLMEYPLNHIKPGSYLLSLIDENNRISLPIYKA